MGWGQSAGNFSPSLLMIEQESPQKTRYLDGNEFLHDMAKRLVANPHLADDPVILELMKAYPKLLGLVLTKEKKAFIG
jgi:hypothetical protein